MQRGGNRLRRCRIRTSAVPASASTAADVRIRIPAIGLDHETSGGGLTPEGTIDPDPGILMWFGAWTGCRRGRVGTAVAGACGHW